MCHSGEEIGGEGTALNTMIARNEDVACDAAGGAHLQACNKLSVINSASRPFT